MKIEEFKEVKKFRIASRTIEDFLEDAQSSSVLRDSVDPSVFESLRRTQKELDQAVEDYQKSEVEEVLKENNVLAFRNSDGVSYTEDVYYHLLTINPDERGYIRINRLVVGKGESGEWFKFEGNTVKYRDDLLAEIKQHKPRVTTVEEFKQYAELSSFIKLNGY